MLDPTLVDYIQRELALRDARHDRDLAERDSRHAAEIARRDDQLAALHGELAALRGDVARAGHDERLLEAASARQAVHVGNSRRRFLTAGLVALGGVAAVGAGAAGALVEQRPVSAQAAAPTTINYQGRLTDSSGNPLTGSYTMSFSLYAAASGGSAVWGPEAHTGTSAVQVNNGLFSVFLGSISGIPAGILTQNLWLGVTVGADPEMTPREQIGTVPYAMQAGNATTVGGYAASTTAVASTVPVLGTGGVLPANTVATASLGDAAVTSRKFKPYVPFVTYGTPVSVPSSGYVDFPGSSVTVTCDVTSQVLCTANVTMQDNSETNLEADFRFNLGGTLSSAYQWQIILAGRGHTFQMAWWFTNVAAGTYTLKLQYAGSSNSALFAGYNLTQVAALVLSA